MPSRETVVWQLRQPCAAAAGLPLARARLDPAREELVHAAPPLLEVEIRQRAGHAHSLRPRFG